MLMVFFYISGISLDFRDANDKGEEEEQMVEGNENTDFESEDYNEDLAFSAPEGQPPTEEFGIGEEDKSAVETTPQQSEEASPEEEETSEVQELTPEEYKARIEELERENKGRLKALAAEREKRQQAVGQLTGLKEVFQGMREEKSVEPQATQETQAPAPIPIEFDDDDTPYVDPSKLADWRSKDPEIKKLRETVQQLQGNITQSQYAQALERATESVIAESPENREAIRVVGEQYNFIDTALASYVEDTGIRPRNIEEAIDIFLSSGLEKEFMERYPNSDPLTVIEAGTIMHPGMRANKLRRALHYAKKDMSKPDTRQQDSKNETGIPEQSRRVAQKPGNLSNVASQDKVGEPTFDDILGMSQEAFERLPKAERERYKQAAIKGGLI